MLNELKILFENIRFKRHLINEGVGDNSILEAIQNHEYIYIYYEGDESNKSGYRTIRPFVLGVSTAGNKVVRAWQDKGKSFSYSNGSRGEEHDYWWDNDAKIKPGWRLFRLDKISSVYPIGKRFDDKDGNVIIPPKYKEGSDDAMINIIAYVSSKKIEPKKDFDVVTKKPSEFDAQTSKWKRFYDANKNNRKISTNDVNNLYTIVKKVWKESPNNFIVVINNKNDFEAIRKSNQDKIPKDVIVGDLTNLYDTMVRTTQNKSEDNKFFDDAKNKLKTNSENTTNNTNRKSFFK